MKSKSEKEIEKLTKMITKLEPQEFVGLCKILGVKIYEIDEEKQENREEKVEVEGENDVEASARGRERPDKDDNKKVKIRDAEVLLSEVIGKIGELNRTQRRNLLKLLKPATRGR